MAAGDARKSVRQKFNSKLSLRFARLLGDHQTFKSKKFLMLILDRVLTFSPLMLDCDPKFGITEAE